MSAPTGARFVGAITSAVLLLPGGAAAAPRPAPETRVISVDGPSRLTVKVGARTLKLRLTASDAPNPATTTAPAECGAAEATRALRRLMRRPQAIEVDLVRAWGVDPARPNRSVPVRDRSGRYLADITWLDRRGEQLGRPLTDRLMEGGWARFGFQELGPGLVDIAGGEAGLPAATDDRDGEDDALQHSAASARRGMWGLCGGRFHLPAGTPVPPRVGFATWEIDPLTGLLDRVGSLDLTALPATGLSHADALVATGPGESVVGGLVCTLWRPDLGLVVSSFDTGIFETAVPAADSDAEAWPTPNCQKAVVTDLTTLGRGVPASLGGRTGDPMAGFLAALPHAAVKRDVFSGLRSSGPGGKFLFFGPPSRKGQTVNGSSIPLRGVTGWPDRKGRVVTQFSARLYDFAPLFARAASQRPGRPG